MLKSKKEGSEAKKSRGLPYEFGATLRGFLNEGRYIKKTLTRLDRHTIKGVSKLYYKSANSFELIDGKLRCL